MPPAHTSSVPPGSVHASPGDFNPRLGAPTRHRLAAAAATLLAALVFASPARADVSGTVVDDAMQPIAGATVHLQADPGGPQAVTAADGTFTLVLSVGGAVRVAASVVYDPDAAMNYHTNAVDTVDPVVGLMIELRRFPATEDPAYQPPAGSQSCQFCHSQIYDEWAASNHSLATMDFWVRDLFSGDGSPGGSNGFVFIDTHDPGETGTCATCHAPMADAFDPGNTLLNEVVAGGVPGQVDGVSCVSCHQLHRADGDVNAIHILGQSEYRFPDGDLPTSRHVFGPLDDVDTSFMRATYAPFFTESRLCASCHQYQAPFGQTTYEEWLDSPFAVAGPDFRSCQDCHMPQRAEEGRICDLGQTIIRPPEQRHGHGFIGSTPETLTANIDLVAEIVSQTPGLVNVRAEVTNRGAGHSFPTGISIRNAMLVMTADVDGQELEQASGPTVPDWADDDVPGKQDGDYAGFAGTGYAKILEGRINGEGDPVSPVLFVDAETVIEHSNIPSGETSVTEVAFALPADVQIGQTINVQTRLLYRRAFRALAVTKGWTETPQGGPIEIEVASVNLDATVTELVDPLEIPTLSGLALALLTALLAGVGLLALRSRR